jgi:hypothetical protein
VKKYMSYKPKSELAWILEDYTEAGMEPPGRIIASPFSCEGQMMTDDEVAEYIRDGVATIIVLRDKGSERTAAVHEAFLVDCQFLYSLGRLNQDEYNELTDLESYRF